MRLYHRYGLMENHGNGVRRLFKNKLLTLLTYGETHEFLFEHEVHGHFPEPARCLRRRVTIWSVGMLRRWGFAATGILLNLLARFEEKGRSWAGLLGEGIAFWRDGGKVHAVADRCPHRGASLSQGHVRFPGSGTLSCPYHGWTFDGTGQLRACIQEGRNSTMPPKVRTKAYPVEERVGLVWVWIGDMEPDCCWRRTLPLAMKAPGVVTISSRLQSVEEPAGHSTFDNFIDGLHAPYLHRLAPQYFFRKLAFRAPDGRPHFQFVEHNNGKILELAHARGAQRPESTKGLVYDAKDFPELGCLPRTTGGTSMESP